MATIARTKKGGAVAFFMDDPRIEKLFPGKKYTRDKFTSQMSDQLPIWVRIKTDIEAKRNAWQ